MTRFAEGNERRMARTCGNRIVANENLRCGVPQNSAALMRRASKEL
jgi:hypothetical protein